ncbi:MAG TPA: alpha/beta fold hydrolase [Haliangiales bacterium]|nr:alpha/beta fold hydrolase [Haliangiales bacterium]
MWFAAREILAYALHGAMTPLPAPRTRRTGSHWPVVLFVHGHGGSSGAFAFLRRSLERRGFSRFAAWDYRSRGRIADAARGLRDRARELGPVHVIAHSMGGLLARYWLQMLGGLEGAVSLTTLSTPHRGIAPLPGARLVPMVREIVRDAPLVDELERTQAALAGLPCLSIVSTRDHFVRPFTHASFAAARLVPVDDVGHVGVLFSREVHRHVAGHLERHRGR